MNRFTYVITVRKFETLYGNRTVVSEATQEMPDLFPDFAAERFLAAAQEGVNDRFPSRGQWSEKHGEQKRDAVLGEGEPGPEVFDYDAAADIPPEAYDGTGETPAPDSVTTAPLDVEPTEYMRLMMGLNVAAMRGDAVELDNAEVKLLLRGDIERGEQLSVFRQERDGAYAERNRLVAALAKVFPACRAETEIEGWEPDWRWCVFVTLPTGQASWHIHESELPAFAWLPIEANPWDGHTTEEKYQRLAALRVKGEPAQEPMLEAMRASVFDEAARLCGVQGISNEGAAVCANMLRERANLERLSSPEAPR